MVLSFDLTASFEVCEKKTLCLGIFSCFFVDRCLFVLRIVRGSCIEMFHDKVGKVSFV